MLRVVIAVASGYAVMSLVIVVALSAAFLVMGPDRSLAPNSYDPSGLWLALWFVSSAVTAVIGGWVARKTAPMSEAPLALGIVVLVLGVA